jgi:hypothetical protein
MQPQTISAGQKSVLSDEKSRFFARNDSTASATTRDTAGSTTQVTLNSFDRAMFCQANVALRPVKTCPPLPVAAVPYATPGGKTMPARNMSSGHRRRTDDQQVAKRCLRDL